MTVRISALDSGNTIVRRNVEWEHSEMDEARALVGNSECLWSGENADPSMDGHYVWAVYGTSTANLSLA